MTNVAHQCLTLAVASRSSLLSKSVRSSASSRSTSICGKSFTNAGLRVTESITAHKSRPGNFSIVYRIVELNLRNRMLASSRRGLLHSQGRTFIGGGRDGRLVAWVDGSELGRTFFTLQNGLRSRCFGLLAGFTLALATMASPDLVPV